MNEKILNETLLGFLGSQELVDNWWVSPNAIWSFQKPIDIFKESPEKICDYLKQVIR